MKVLTNKRRKWDHHPMARFPRAVVRACRSSAVLAVWALTVVTDLVPARWRFGRWNRLLGVVAVRSGLPAVAAAPARADSARAAEEMALVVQAGSSDGSRRALRCVLVAGALDSGGVETVVETLALGLPAHGVEVHVLATQDGATAGRLRAAGVDVDVVAPHETTDRLRLVGPDVIQLHRADPELVTPLIAFGHRTVPVFHALESYLDDSAWQHLRDLVDAAPSSIAVSDAVARFVAERTGRPLPRTVVNGVSRASSRSPLSRPAARGLVSAVVPDLEDDDILVVGLQRFSDQKNAAGLVDAFLLAAESEPRLRLVLAGAPSSWLEVRRADVLRRAHDRGHRVHLLGESDPWVLFAAADVYALDSFSEGGPISALEAVSCGLPVVLSDVGFTRQLVEAADGWGEVVPSALPDASQRELARARRQRHQRNRAEFARALLRVSRMARQRVPATPAPFTEPAMVADHAEILRAAARP
ncbi:hypothetical protein GCM10022219_18840 [Microbacterium oryzae]|nr:glycosyltransferase [Microbacterium oryzae]